MDPQSTWLVKPNRIGRQLKGLIAALLLSSAASFAEVEVNKASATQLQSIKGIGPVMSTRIMNQRRQGKFQHWQDLIDRVSGVGALTAYHYSAQGLTVNGMPYEAASPSKLEMRTKVAPPLLPPGTKK